MAQQPKPPPSRSQLGPPIAWSDTELDALAQISPADIAAAQAMQPVAFVGAQAGRLRLLDSLLHATLEEPNGG